MKKLLDFAWRIAVGVCWLFITAAASGPAPKRQADNPNPPDHPVKLIFIHHSTGENWLRDDYGGLGRALAENNYFVSDTNYGWGPDAIGDRTDIPNWTEWFASERTPVYMDALFNESGQNSSYTRPLPDPGGENEIIMFKSCFPNSELGGSPNDPPGTYEDMTVAGAKYVYNTILQYFATRPDKLFVVITAPPVSDSTFAANARAFNNWLLNDWLRENHYALNNVAVFDFYNILTDPNAHHRFHNGQVEHVLGGRNTLYYPSGDDHPSEAGSRKATEEFVPLLNVFYHRWAGRIGNPSYAPTPAVAVPSAQPAASAGVIDDFESGAPAGAFGWEAFHDEIASTTMTCGIETGTGRIGNSLRLDFNIAANSWGTCALLYEGPQDWSAGEGLVFYFRAAQPGLLFDVDIYAGPQDNRETYLYTIEAPPESAANWIPMELRWEDFHRAAWEAEAGTPFAKAAQVAGMAFGLGTLPDAPNSGAIWVDDVRLLGAAPQAAPLPSAAPPPPAERPEAGRPNLPCIASLLAPLFLIGLARLVRLQ